LAPSERLVLLQAARVTLLRLWTELQQQELGWQARVAWSRAGGADFLQRCQLLWGNK